MGRKLRITIPIKTVSQEYVEWKAEQSASSSMENHEFAADPHPQYTTEAEVLALTPPQRFVSHWKWS